MLTKSNESNEKVYVVFTDDSYCINNINEK